MDSSVITNKPSAPAHGVRNLLLPWTRGGLRDGMVENRPFLDFLTHAILILGVAIVAFPVYVTFYSGGMKREYRLIVSDRSQTFVVYLKDKPEKLVLDDSYSTARMLGDEEIPVRISDFFKVKSVNVIFSEKDREKYSELLKLFPNAVLLAPDQIQARHLKDRGHRGSAAVSPQSPTATRWHFALATRALRSRMRRPV